MSMYIKNARYVCFMVGGGRWFGVQSSLIYISLCLPLKITLLLLPLLLTLPLYYDLNK